MTTTSEPVIKIIEVPWEDGMQLTLHITQRFEDMARRLFNLGPDEPVIDEQYKQALLQSLQAVNRVQGPEEDGWEPIPNTQI